MPPFVAVVGPPAVGKSTVTGALADRLGVRVFRLREFAHEFRVRPGIDQRLFDTSDPLGWFCEDTVALLVRAAFLHGQLSARPMVILENFPGSLIQFRLLNAVTAQLRAPLAVLELIADDDLLAIRVRNRRGSKLTILGGEPTLHPRFGDAIRYAKAIGYEHVITTSNGLDPTIRKFRRMTPDDFAYIQISLDGGSPISHDQIRGKGTFHQALRNVAELAESGFDTRIICTVNRVNASDCLNLLDIADELGVSLVKFHVFSVIGSGRGTAEWGMQPLEWIEFYEHLERVAPDHRTRVWYQPTYARRNRIAGYAVDGYRGCIGRTLDRISIFPDGRAYVCSYLFDTDLNFANMIDGQVVLNHGENEFDLFTGVLSKASCGGCKVSSACMGGCPAEEIVMGSASCRREPEIVPVCRLWKADIPTQSSSVDR